MTAQTWLPILTLALGWAGAQATEMYRHRTASRRERQARRDELQTNTLLELQDTLLELFSLTSPAQGAFVRYVRDHSNESERKEAIARLTEVHGQFRNADAKARLLISRVEDEQVRRSATLFLDTAGIVLKLSRDTEVAKLLQIPEAYGQVIDRTGELLRERY